MWETSRARTEGQGGIGNGVCVCVVGWEKGGGSGREGSAMISAFIPLARSYRRA